MTKNLTIILIITIFVLMACEKSTKVYLLPERTEIEEALIRAVSQDEALSLDGLNDGAARDKEYTASALAKITLGDTLGYDYSKIKFGRIMNQVSDTIMAIDIGWDSATVEVRYKVSGQFKVVRYRTVRDSSIAAIHYLTTTYKDTTAITIDSTYVDSLAIWLYDTTYTIVTVTDTLDSTITWSYSERQAPQDSSNKSFNLTSRQKAIFLRTQNTNNARKDWQLKKVTPMLIANSSSALGIEQVMLTISGTPTTVKLPTTSGGDPLGYYFSRDTLPSINYNSTLDASVTVSNSSPYGYAPGELVLLHFGQSISENKRRIALADSDNNGSHTGNFTVNSHGTKVYRLFVDLLDLRTIFITDATYNSEILMIPFRVP